MVRNRESADRYVPLVLGAGSYFPGRQDLETKWVKCASTMAERGITGRGRVGIFISPAPNDESRRSRNHFPWAAFMLYVMVNIRRPLSSTACEFTVLMNQPNRLTLTRDINVLKCRFTNASRPSSKLSRLLGSKIIGRPDFLVEFRRTVKLPHLTSRGWQSIKNCEERKKCKRAKRYYPGRVSHVLHVVLYIKQHNSTLFFLCS